MPRVLIVAYGNPLRSDDGVAWRAADLLFDKFTAHDVVIVNLHQLTPELAETFCCYERVIFLDAAFSENAALPAGTIRVEEITIDTPEAAAFTHSFSPRKVLGLAAKLYGVRPRAFSVTVRGSNFDHGNALSAPVADALPDLISTIERLVQGTVSKA